MMRAVLSGYYGKGNGGDEALLATLLQLLPEHVTPIVLSGNPAQTAQTYGVEAYDRMSLPQVWKALRSSEALIWGGGSLMQDATSAMSPLYYGSLMAIAQTLGLKTIAWGQGIGPLNRSWVRWLTRYLFKRCTAVSVRDPGSAVLLSSWKVPFTLAPDPVWALNPEPVPGLWDLPAPRVAVALRSHPLLNPERLATLTKALNLFQKASDVCILLVPFQATQDLAIAQAIQPHLSGVSHIVSLEDPQQLMGLFQGVEMTISMRLHGLIMAAAAACRCFALSYDPKVTQLMRDLDLPGWELAALPNNPTAISSTWLEHYANGDGLSPDQIHSLVDRALMHQEILREVLR